MVSALLAGAVMAAAMVNGPAVWAAARYGDAVVEEGTMTIVREGQSLSFKASGQAVPVNERDLVRVRDASRVVLKTADRATVTLGSNAVFQVEPWQQQEKSGLFRMLFGRFRAGVTGLAGGERFNVKTATATIGVKGTENALAVANNGNAVLLGIENVTTLSGKDGVDQGVGPNQVSAVIGGGPATPPVGAPDEFKKEMGGVNSPPAGSPGAASLPAEQALIQAGVISQDALNKSKEQGPQLQPPPTPPTAPAPSIYLDDAQQASQQLRGKLNLHFEK